MDIYIILHSSDAWLVLFNVKIVLIWLINVRFVKGIGYIREKVLIIANVQLESKKNINPKNKYFT
jgi:hypothetical protein